jgi:hypothetical protein
VFKLLVQHFVPNEITRYVILVNEVINYAILIKAFHFLNDQSDHKCEATFARGSITDFLMTD